MDFKVGDEIITAKELWHNGENVGNRLGRILSTKGHIIIDIYNYDDNPVKCFRYEVEPKPKNPFTTYHDVVEEFELDLDPLI